MSMTPMVVFDPGTSQPLLTPVSPHQGHGPTIVKPGKTLLWLDNLGWPGNSSEQGAESTRLPHTSI